MKITLLGRIMTILILLMIPIYAIAFSIYYYGSREIESQISSSIMKNAFYYMDTLDKELQRIRLLKFSVFEDNNIGYLTYIAQDGYDYDKLKAMRDLLQRLFYIQNSSSYIEDVTVFIPRQGKSISSTRIDDFNLETYVQFGISSQMNRDPLKFFQGQPYLIDSYPFILDETEELADFIFTIALSESEIRKSLQALRFDFGGETFMLHENGEYSIIEEGSFFSEESLYPEFAEYALEKGEGFFHYTSDKTPYLGIFKRSEYSGLILFHIIPELELFTPLRRYLGFFWVFTIFSIVLITLFAVTSHRLLHRPLRLLVGAFQKLEAWDISVHIDNKEEYEFGYLFHAFNRMVSQINKLIKDVYEKELLVRDARFSQLQAQINPHFLYNSFFILQRRINSEDIEGASKMSAQLGKYFQYVTHSEQDTVPLSIEFKHVCNYIDIQTIRFARRLTVELEELPENCAHLKVPRLILQPLVENAFKYGLEDKSSNCFLKISFETKEDCLLILIDDNGGGMTETAVEQLRQKLEAPLQHQEISGLVNIHKRLRIFFGNESGLTITPLPSGGLRAVVKIPRAPEGRNV